MSQFDNIVFKNKKFSDLLEEIYNNQKKKDQQVTALISELKPLISDIGDATLVVPLIKEYTYRYGKRHKSQDVIEWCVTNKVTICDKGFTDPPKAMPDEYKVGSVVDSYRNYYMGAKSTIATWKNREIPSWFKSLQPQ